MKKLIFCCVLFLGTGAIAYCSQTSRIELSDGTVIQGEIVSLDKGVYTVNTGSLGAVKVDMLKVRRIETENAPATMTINAPAPAAAGSSADSGEAIKAEMDRVKSKIDSDPELMKNVAGLALDPQFQEALKDPEIISAVKSHDVKSLMKNEKFIGILNNRKFQEIQNRVKEDKDK